MNIGTKSVLFGVHQFLIHPCFVAWAWWRLYGFPADIRLWIAFFIHDLGYWGKPNMDGREGERHVEFGASFMGYLFGNKWREFCLYHSRFYAKRDGKQFSRLCVADKLAIVLEPWWLYLPRAWLSSELWEYMSLAKYKGEQYVTIRGWHRGTTAYLRRWVAVHRDERRDTWTPDPSFE